MRLPRTRQQEHNDFVRRMTGGTLYGRVRSAAPISPHTRPTRRTVGVTSEKPWPDLFLQYDDQARVRRTDREGNAIWTSEILKAPDEFPQEKIIEVSKQHGLVLVSDEYFLTNPAGYYLLDYETGSTLWEKFYIRNDRDNGAILTNGNIVVGHSNDSSNLGTLDLFDKDGNLLEQWVYPDTETRIAGVSSDSNSNVYFSGYGSSDTRYWKLDSDLNLIWQTNNGLDGTYNAFVVDNDVPGTHGYDVNDNFAVRLFDPSDGSVTGERLWTEDTSDFTVLTGAAPNKIALASWDRTERVLVMDNSLNDIWVVTGTDIMQEAYYPKFDPYGRVWVWGFDSDWNGVFTAFDAENGDVLYQLFIERDGQDYYFSVSPGRYAAGFWS